MSPATLHLHLFSSLQQLLTEEVKTDQLTENPDKDCCLVEKYLNNSAASCPMNHWCVVQPTETDSNNRNDYSRQKNIECKYFELIVLAQC